jgi:hypothetical protein
MALFSIPAPYPGWGFFLPPAEPSIFSTTRPSSRRHQRPRTGRADRSSWRPSLRVCSSWVMPTGTISTIGWAHGAGGIGMQRVWAVGVSVMSVNFVGIADGRLSMIGWGMAGSTATARGRAYSPVRPCRLEGFGVT